MSSVSKTCEMLSSVGLKQQTYYSKVRVGQQYGTFAERLAELSKKACTTKTTKSDNGDIITYYDEKGEEIGYSMAPNAQKDTAGAIVDGKTTFWSNKDGKITTIGDVDKEGFGTVYNDENGDGKIDDDEASSGYLA